MGVLPVSHHGIGGDAAPDVLLMISGSIYQGPVALSNVVALQASLGTLQASDPVHNIRFST